MFTSSFSHTSIRKLVPIFYESVFKVDQFNILLYKYRHRFCAGHSCLGRSIRFLRLANHNHWGSRLVSSLIWAVSSMLTNSVCRMNRISQVHVMYTKPCVDFFCVGLIASGRQDFLTILERWRANLLSLPLSSKPLRKQTPSSFLFSWSWRLYQCFPVFPQTIAEWSSALRAKCWKLRPRSGTEPRRRKRRLKDMRRTCQWLVLYVSHSLETLK